MNQLRSEGYAVLIRVSLHCSSSPCHRHSLIGSFLCIGKASVIRACECPERTSSQITEEGQESYEITKTANEDRSYLKDCGQYTYEEEECLSVDTNSGKSEREG